MKRLSVGTVAAVLLLLNVLVAATPAAAKPINLVPANGATISTAARAFSWGDNEANLNSYYVEIADSPALDSFYGTFLPSHLKWASESLNTTSVTIGPFDPGTYYWHVQGVYYPPTDPRWHYAWSAVQSFTVQAPPAPPRISLSPASLSFTITQGDASDHTQYFTISNSGGGTLNWRIALHVRTWWWTGTPVMIGAATRLPLVANATGLQPGTYTSKVNVQDAGSSPPASNSPQSVALTLVVVPSSINHPPSLEGGGVSPGTGDTNTDFRFAVRYTDVDGNTPATMNLVCDGVSYPVTYTATSATTGVCRYEPLRLKAGVHSFHFEVSDGHGGSAVFPASGDLTGPMVTESVPPPASAPQINALTPTHGVPGTSVTIAGSGFGATQGTSSVTFGASAASVTSWSATTIACQVPNIASGATTVTVTVGGRTSNTSSFTVDAAADAPRIASLTPTYALPGASVTVAGSGFGATQGASGVKFGTTAATVSAWTPAAVTCTVPAMASGATTVTVTVGGLTSNVAAFTVAAARTMPSLMLKLTGLSSGSLKLGRRVRARCTVTPSSLVGGQCRLTVQKKRGTRWARVAALTWTIGPSGSYIWKYKPAMRGSYRMQATVAATAQHTSGKAPWLAFRVK